MEARAGSKAVPRAIGAACPSHGTSRSVGAPSPCYMRGCGEEALSLSPGHTAPLKGHFRTPLQISPAALDPISHPVLAALDFPPSVVTVVPWLWLQCM